ncbi:Chalcone isomerase [Corchorus olitorius]|uniref:Chalcone-flavonone isomerase family protein n=1 Tax=Corchorus olitorius TaxID=93759 RepID=A0A1R3K6L8_9ROSI|nr:Chalcone isomerase [Corchorus olitorius]
MSTSRSVTGIQIENVAFSPTVKPPGSTKTLFLGGAGERGLEIQGKFIKFTAIGVYLEDNAVDCLATKWKGKSDGELTESVEFFRDIVTGAFEKFIRVTMILPLTGQQYSEKVAENCVAIWKSLGLYTDEEAKAIEKFVEVFKNENFPPGSSILFTISAQGSLTIGFSQDSSVPEVGTTVIENKLLANSVLESIIGKAGVSPAAKQSLASRLPALFNDSANQKASANGNPEFKPPSVTAIQVENVTFPSTVKPPGSTKTLFLGGAGERGLEIQGKFIKFTAIGVYLEDNAVECLGVKWKGKNTEELTESIEFFRDIITGAFEKFIRVTMILPLTGQQYSEKVAENCVAIWKSLGLYTDEEAKAIEKFVEVFKNENFPPGSSILFTISAQGSLTIGFSKDSSVPESGAAVIDNKLLANSVLESIIGKGGVSPAAKQSLASRLPELFNGAAVNGKTESE